MICKFLLCCFQDESTSLQSQIHQEEKKEDDKPVSYSSAIREVVQGLPLPQGSLNGYEAAAFLHPQDEIETITADLVTDEHEEAQTSTGKCESQGAVARTPTTPCGPCEDVQQEKDTQIEAAETWHNEFPLAIKMMFNYEAESNAPAILKAMYKEILPAQCAQLDPAQQEWQERLCGPRVCLPPHPNIVDMPCVFVDRVPLLEGCLDLYPHALPARLNPQGYGRNMSLFCVMKRYDISLREYLQKYHPSQHTCLLLLTQLLEGLLHLHTNNIVHRDLKSDNILLSLAEGWQYPLLVVSDFGCSLVGDNSNLSVPFPSREADPRQGNAALMAPEVKTAMPGLLSSVFFGQSDLWAAGTLIYEIYGLDNPFSPAAALHRRSKQLDSATYKESHLPRLPRTAPPWIRHLTADILRRNPRTRPTVNVAATLCQLMLWAPSKWLNRHSLSLPTHTEVTQWLLCLATKVLCEARLPHAHASTQRERKRNAGLEGNADHQGSQLEYQLVSTFLGRVHYVDIIQAIKWNRAF
ncbi:Serine/threonine-protein kinase PINK1, mitochondrial [Portunus trituberculatus]|uniref:non-specific serine/threonine protein kinase n=1 Tax=Portunus trituberculatus TaxID=210409 RepID=A0A5B7DCB3_PORTR|nr:Serine/threonine-protein kinase PINK1, mitochondrial [Portunus trituberculatus]